MSLPLRIFLAPALIGLASLVGRRWGPTVSGWLIGLPFSETYPNVDSPPLVLSSCFTAASFTRGLRLAPALSAPQAF